MASRTVYGGKRVLFSKKTSSLRGAVVQDRKDKLPDAGGELVSWKKTGKKHSPEGGKKDGSNDQGGLSVKGRLRPGEFQKKYPETKKGKGKKGPRIHG